VELINGKLKMENGKLLQFGRHCEEQQRRSNPETLTGLLRRAKRPPRNDAPLKVNNFPFSIFHSQKAGC